MTNDDNFLSIVCDAVFARYAKVGFSHLSKPDQVFICVWSLVGEVDNGGFEQFFFNSSGDYALETVDALESIGASRTAGIVRRANAVFDSAVPLPDLTERRGQLDALPESAQDAFDTLDEQFSEYTDFLDKLLISYVLVNEKVFRTP